MNEKLDHLLKQAGEIFMRYGLKSVTMDDVCRELGISKKTLYQHVTDKNDLISKVLVYDPERRLKPLEALLHPFFDELREQKTVLPSGDKMIDLFDFSREEIASTSPEIMEQLIPKWYNK
jgi:AcrR family transcriptional regulator